MSIFNTDFNTTGLCDGNRMAPYEMQRADRTSLKSKMVFPASYSQNTQKEDLVLEYVDNFRSQFTALMPTRPPLLLQPQNECDCRKFISTYIRPTHLRFEELYDYTTCARYIANYIQYEPLEQNESGDERTWPQNVYSPTTVMHWQVGNSIEMSLVLCSLLIGNGYNAFVVVGYAVPDVCQNDQSKSQWPDALPEEVDPDAAMSKGGTTDTFYTQHLKQRPILVSKYDAEELEREREELNNILGPQIDGDIEDILADPELQQGLHAWVLLMPGKRKIEKPIFIEPSTGRTAEISDPSYTRIDAVFNHNNYYVNMNPESRISELSFDLRDLSKWEFIFLRDPEMIEEEEAEKTKISEELTADVGESGDLILDLPASWVSALTLSKMQFENRYPGKKKKVMYSNAVVEMFAEYSEADLKIMTVAIPDTEMSALDQVHTFYKHRADRLRRRSIYPTDKSQGPRKIHSWFLPGRPGKDGKVEGLRELINEPGIQRTMKFYWNSREDGLAQRTELFFNEKEKHPRKIKEFYRGRGDRLKYRSASYELPKESPASMGLPTEKIDSQKPVRMSEKFERNRAVPADEDVMKRTYIRPLTPDGEIWLFFQYRDDCITRPFRMFPHNAEREKESTTMGAHEMRPKVVTMPFCDPPEESHLTDELRLMLGLEKDCEEQIRNKAKDAGEEILETFKRDQEETPFVLSAYDTLRNRPKETEAELAQLRAEETRRAESRKDYLAPYIAKQHLDKACNGDYSNIVLKPEEAKKVRDAALRDLKERLIQRGHIMQQDMDREKEELNRRQMAHHKNMDTNENAKDSEEFAQFCKDATWRMKILDKRLSDHIDNASKKYAQLAQRLAADPRLASIYEAQK